jgi:hypothetical protein
MSSGEVIIYGGSNPADSNNWILLGVFRVGAPVSDQALAKIGSDLVVATQDGYVALTTVLPFGRAQRSRALSTKIVDAAQEAVRLLASNVGWQIILYPKGQMLLVNVPANSTTFHQHVMNSETGAWCRFKGLNGHCWSLFNDHLYFGTANGKVCKADDGTSDLGTVITTDGQTAWHYMNDRSRLKRFTGARPVFLADGDPGVTMALGVDFTTDIPTNAVAAPQPGDSAVWDQAIWDQGVWGGAYRVARSWQSVSGIGYCAALRVRTSNAIKQVRWAATTYMYEGGGLL